MHLFVSNHNTLAPARINAQWLMEQAGLPFLMQAFPPHTLYLMLQTQDLQENLELIEWIRGAQLQKVLDFDIWELNTQIDTEDISYHAVLSWVQAWLVFGKSFASERFFELEEETALLMLSKFFNILPEGIAHISDEIRENWTITPDKRFFIQPTSSEGTDFEILTEFIDALYGADMQKAGFLFSAASLLVRQDTLEIAQKWRNARLADQGFIQKDEALSILFSTKNLPIPLSKFKNATKVNYFIEDAIENTMKFIVSLQPDDGMHLMKQALGGEGLKQLTGSQNINIEHLYDDNEFILDCVEYIAQVAGKIFNQIEYSHTQIESQKSNLLIECSLALFLEKDANMCLLLKQKIARLSNTVASTLAAGSNSYQNNTVNTALTLTRGCLNVGLELCLENEDLYKLEFQTQDAIQNAMYCIEHLGVEYIFKLGFHAILDLQKNLLNYLFENKLISTKKTASALRWLNSDQFGYTTEMRLAFQGLLNFVPMCHTELFAQDVAFKEMPIYLSQQFKPFEHKTEIIFMQRFLQNIHHNLH